VPMREVPAQKDDMALADDTAFDARLLSMEVSRRLTIEMPGSDSWKR